MTEAFIFSGPMTAVLARRYRIPQTKEDWAALAVIAVVYLGMTLLLKKISNGLSEKSRNVISGIVAFIAGIITYAVMK
ncbi:MAG: hypothetical protein IJ874_00335 [Ruminococcus sp.]|nr:hypothetical protein [Ruminococcus sp.]